MAFLPDASHHPGDVHRRSDGPPAGSVLACALTFMPTADPKQLAQRICVIALLSVTEWAATIAPEGFEWRSVLQVIQMSLNAPRFRVRSSDERVSKRPLRLSSAYRQLAEGLFLGGEPNLSFQSGHPGWQSSSWNQTPTR